RWARSRTDRTARTCAPRRGSPGHRSDLSKSSSVVFGKPDEATVSCPDHVVAAGLRGQRRLRLAVLAKAIKVELAVERMQVVILADHSLDAGYRRVEAQELVLPAPGILEKFRVQAQFGQG